MANDRITTIKNKVNELNNKAVKNAESFVEETLATGTEWQELLAKAAKRGTVLLDNQQDITFKTLSTIKGQYINSAKRLQQLFKGAPKKQKATAKPAKAKTQTVETPAAKEANKKATTKTTSPKKAAAPKTQIPKAPKNIKNDLTEIVGIGPKTAEQLNKAGISTFTQLAALNVTDFVEILQTNKISYKKGQAAYWIEQAQISMIAK